jgi:hypothetical protein
MRQSEWKREYRRARCGKPVAPAVQAGVLNRKVGPWEAAALARAIWLGRATMRAHKLTLIGDCRRAPATWHLRLP